MKFGPNRRISVTRFIKDALIRVLHCLSSLCLSFSLTNTHAYTRTKQLAEAAVGTENLRTSLTL